MERTILLATAITTALMAGLFYSWTCSVIPGLTRLPDSSFLAAMQAINRAILNPLFFVGFLGAAFLLPVCAWQQYQGHLSIRYLSLLGAAAIYWIGVMAVTMFGNVPLNDMLDAAHLRTIPAEKLTDLRAAFERPWIRLNNVRTIASVLALVLVLIACTRPVDQGPLHN